LDLRRNPGTEHRRHFAELLRLRYGQRNVDIIGVLVFIMAQSFLIVGL
jgi:hypothetical protein